MRFSVGFLGGGCEMPVVPNAALWTLRAPASGWWPVSCCHENGSKTEFGDCISECRWLSKFGNLGGRLSCAPRAKPGCAGSLMLINEGICVGSCSHLEIWLADGWAEARLDLVPFKFRTGTLAWAKFPFSIAEALFKSPTCENYTYNLFFFHISVFHVLLSTMSHTLSI